MGDSTLKKVAVIGSGTMGNGIAQVFATCGAQVLLVDINPEGLAKGVAAIEKSLAKLAEKGVITADHQAASRARLRSVASGQPSSAHGCASSAACLRARTSACSTLRPRWACPTASCA